MSNAAEFRRTADGTIHLRTYDDFEASFWDVAQCGETLPIDDNEMLVGAEYIATADLCPDCLQHGATAARLAREVRS